MNRTEPLQIHSKPYCRRWWGFIIMIYMLLQITSDYAFGNHVRWVDIRVGRTETTCVWWDSISVCGVYYVKVQWAAADDEGDWLASKPFEIEIRDGGTTVETASAGPKDREIVVEVDNPSATSAGTHMISARVRRDASGERWVYSDHTVAVMVIGVVIKNPTTPTKGSSNDSDDYFFRGLDEPDVKIYYDLLPTSFTPSEVKLLIKEDGVTLREIELPNTSGTNLLAEWDGKKENGLYYFKWDYDAQIEVDGICKSNLHRIQELLYKHRPEVYRHANELSGPQDVSCMMKYADLYLDTVGNDLIKEGPLDYGDLEGPNDTTNHFQDLHNSFRQVNYEQNAIYYRGTEQSSYIFLQYWHFEPSSSIPESTDVYHEGDWEMFQIAVEPNITDEELKPIAVTASQHYYGQTIRWAEIGNGPGSQDQDYVGKWPSENLRPIVYVALNSHATYFRGGYFRVSSTPGDTSNHGLQYETAPLPWPIRDDATEWIVYNYVLYEFDHEMIPYWHGNWGEELWVPGSSDNGPPSPKYRNTAKIMWTDPKGFHNYYLKLTYYPGGSYAHPELKID